MCYKVDDFKDFVKQVPLVSFKLCPFGSGLDPVVVFFFKKYQKNYKWWPSITDGVHRTENFVEIIPVFSTFSNFFKKKPFYVTFQCGC